ncbi:hypothetical protein [Streptomyces sp. NPDC018031]|uniref:hypothetical protein n=1 Tax=Streptomyces sp. NPDC018031 TaxID=3365033 RepID=UPI0037A364A2
MPADPYAPGTTADPYAPSTTAGPYAPAPSPDAPDALPAARRRIRGPRLGFGLLGPRRARHSVSVDRLSALSLPIGDDGVVAGIDQQGEPVMLGLSRPVPFDVVLVGGLWTAQILALRTAGTGTRVAVETGRAQSWARLVQAAGGGHPCMVTHEVGRVAPQGASVRGPVLVVRDCGIRPPRGRVTATPWQSVLTLLPYLSPVAPRLLEHAGLVGVQRVSPDEAEEIGRVMALPRADVAALSTLPDWVTLWCTRGWRQYVSLRATEAESGLLGAPRRVD